MAEIKPLSYCLAQLKTRLRSEWELDQAMKRKEVEAGDRERTLASLKEIGLIDDLRYARSWIHTRDRLAPRGATVLRQELVQRGIPRQLVDQALAERAEEAADEEAEQPTEIDLAKQLVQSRKRLYANLDEQTRTRRLTAFLQRRGFSYEVIRRIL